MVDKKIFISKMGLSHTSKIGHQLHEVYNGEENALQIEKLYKTNFVCRFRSVSHDFPFGSEICYFRGFIKGSDSLNTEINMVKFETSTTDAVNQFEVKYWKNISLDEAQEAGILRYGRQKSQFFVIVRLCSSMDTVFLVTYLPTILMNIINQAVVYIGSSEQSSQE